MNSIWLSEQEWQWAQQVLPILCVDAVPVRQFDDGLRFGLILRETPHQGQRWCFVGGRVRRAETLDEALDREWRAAFGATCPLGSVLKDCPAIIEYRPDATAGRPHDPRKHAVAITYVVLTGGEPVASGAEAMDFRWFHPIELSSDVVGFGQETVIPGLVEVVDRSATKRE